MPLFKRKKTTPTQAASPSPTSGKQSSASAPTDFGEQDPYFGDAETRAACESLENGSWEQADALLNERNNDSWTFGKITSAASVETAQAWAADNATGRSLTVLGAAEIDAAWEVRGNGPGSSVGVFGAASFHQILGQAEETLRKAIELDDDLATPWGYLMSVGMGLGKPVEERRSYFDEAHRRDPFHSAAVSSATQALAAKWGGSSEELLEFARWVDSEAPEGHPARMALPCVYHENAFQAGFAVKAEGGNFLVGYSSYLDDDELLESLTRLLNATPEIAPPSLVSALNYHFYVALPGQPGAEAIHMQLLKALDNRNTDYPWGSFVNKTPRQEFLERQQRIVQITQQTTNLVDAMMADMKRRVDNGEIETTDEVRAALDKIAAKAKDKAA